MFREIIRLLRELNQNLLTLLGEVRHTNKLIQAQLDAMREKPVDLRVWIDEADDITSEAWDAAHLVELQRRRGKSWLSQLHPRVRGERL